MLIQYLKKIYPRMRAFGLLAFVFATLINSCMQASKAKKFIFAEVETDEIDVASRLAGRVKKVLVQEGESVKAGERLVEFEDDIMSVKKQGALATITAAESKRDIANDAVREEEKTQLAAAVVAAKKQLDFAQSSYERMRLLLKEGAIAQQNFDEVEYKFHAAKAAYDAAVAKQKMAAVGARPEEKAAAQALVDQAKSVLQEVEAYEKDLGLVAPFAGEVAQIIAKEGELVPTGYPVMTLLKMDQPWVTFNVPEEQLRAFPMGKKIKLEIPAANLKNVPAKISYIAALGNFAARNFTQERGSFDLKTFEIRAKFIDQVPILRPGMTALVSRTDP